MKTIVANDACRGQAPAGKIVEGSNPDAVIPLALGDDVGRRLHRLRHRATAAGPTIAGSRTSVTATAGRHAPNTHGGQEGQVQGQEEATLSGGH